MCSFRGYIEAIREIELQTQASHDKFQFDDIVVACGRYCLSILDFLWHLQCMPMPSLQGLMRHSPFLLLSFHHFLNFKTKKDVFFLHSFSGGTIAGLSLGARLSSLKAKVWRKCTRFDGLFGSTFLIIDSQSRFMHSLFVTILVTSTTLSKA